jgi:two-component system, cell cycle sensor histidine kinase and response regulator CckA
MTEQNDQAKALGESQAHFRVLFEQAAVGVALLDTMTGRFQRVNRKYQEIVGFSAAELGALDFMAITHPEDLAGDLAQMDRLKRGEIREFSMEKRLLRKDRTEVWVDLSVSPTWSAGEAPSTHIAVVVDITERKRAEEKTELARAELESTLTALPDLLFDVDDEGRIYDYRARTDSLLAVPPEAFMGRRFMDVLPPEPCAVLGAAIREAIETGRSSGFRYKLSIAGVDRWFETSMARKSVTSGRPRVIAISRDITDRVVAEEQRSELEAQLRQSQKMEAVGTLAGGIAHDFNNLLTVIGLGAEVVQRQLPPGHGATASLRAIDTAVRRAEKLIQQILAFSRKTAAHRTVLSVNDAVVEATNFLRATLPAGIRLELRLAPDAPRLRADPTQLQQVLVNLGTNAWQAIERGIGTITFETRTEMVVEGHPKLAPGVYATVRVTDDGVGMTAETIERIFEPFFTTKGPGKGSGLGLSVVHGIVLDHAGAIVVDSRPGGGTTFDVYLAAESAPVEPTILEATAARGQGGRVLYVDDEAMILPAAIIVLEALGYQAQALSDPAEALERIRATPSEVDVLITDLSMPGLSGIDLARAVREIRADLPIVLVSGYSVQSDEELAAAGIAHRLSKPFDTNAMGTVLQAAFATRENP